MNLICDCLKFLKLQNIHRSVRSTKETLNGSPVVFRNGHQILRICAASAFLVVQYPVADLQPEAVDHFKKHAGKEVTIPAGKNKLPSGTVSRYQRKDEDIMSFAEHRERLYQSFAENTLVIVYAGIPIHTNEDGYHDFVVNSQYFYLTGLERENTAFLAYKTAEKTREILFIEEPDPLSERWTGKMPTVEEAWTISGIEDVRYTDSLEGAISSFMGWFRVEQAYFDLYRCQMNDLPECMKGHVKGGGSLTALPIIETQAGDVSAYIPTNVISITDGQIFLESDLFNQGFRPAINVGISVSRVGGSAQIKSMKKVAGTLKIDQAQYRELEAFSKFSSDMDAVTAMTLDRGRKNNQLLIQPQYSPMPVGEQIAILYCGVHGLMREVPIDKVRECQAQFLDKLRSANPEVIATLASGKIDDETTAKIEAVMADIAGTYKV